MKGKVKRSSVPIFALQDFSRKGESVYIHISTNFPDFVGVLHKHEFIEIVYIISGNATHMVGNHKYSVSKGDLCIINFDTPHAFVSDPGEEFVAYDLMFTTGFVDSSLLADNFETIGSSYLFYSLFPEEYSYQPDLHLVGSSFSAFGEIFNKIYFEYQAKNQGYVEIIRAYIIELIVKMLRKIDKSEQHRISPRQEQIVQNALDYLREHYNTHITTKVLASSAFLNKNYFGKLFRDITGKPVSLFLQEIRIEEACNLLCTTDMKIHDLAFLCGYDDLKNFYTAFKKVMGVTPGVYRQSIKANLLKSDKTEGTDKEIESHE